MKTTGMVGRRCTALAAGLALCGGPAEVSAQGFGRAIAVSNGQLIVGEPQFGGAPGTVYLYERGGGAWMEAGQLSSPDGVDGDGFGWSLAADGDRLLVSALNPRSGVGSVYVFSRVGERWEARGQLAPGMVGEGLAFGMGAAVQGDVAAVGAGSPRGQGAGEVHLFRYEGDAWEPIGILAAPETSGRSAFGTTLRFVGGDLLVGDPLAGGSSGTVHVYRSGAAGFEAAGQLTISDGQESLFGLALAGVDDMLLVGAGGLNRQTGGVVFFERAEGAWTEAGRLQAFDIGRGDQFGASVVAEGNTVFVGAPGSNGRRGQIYAFTTGGDGDWVDARKLTVPDLEPGAGLGSVLILADGALVSGLPGDDYGAGTAHVFEDRDGAWTSVQSIFSEVEGYEAIVGGQVDCSEGSAEIFACGEVDLVSFVPVADLGGGRGTRVNDVWGWTDANTNREYAIVGRTDGTSFVDITDPYSPTFLGSLPKTKDAPGSTWRDMKVYKDHVFVVSDGAEHHGMQVFDLTRLRDWNGTPQTFDEDAHYDALYSAHNIVINEETGFAYAVGTRGGGETCGGGLHIIDIRDPKRPEFAGCFADAETGRRNTGYTHDAQCVVYGGPDAEHRGKEVCFSSNETALSIGDVTDKDSPVALSNASYPNVGYSHQGWLTEDHTFFYMNDELDELQGSVAGTRTLIWDVTDLDDPILVKEHISENLASDHNLYIRGNLMYQSNYQSGLRVLDISDKGNPEEVAFFDTVPGEDLAGMGGSWSNYPFFESGVVIVTSGSQGLFLVRKRERTPVS